MDGMPFGRYRLIKVVNSTWWGIESPNPGKPGLRGPVRQVAAMPLRSES